MDNDDARDWLRQWPKLELLTERQQHVVHLLAEGMSRRQVADALGIRPPTVTGHIVQIRVRLRGPAPRR
jgi:DNA-binding NarL/FixJ family response regulator